jgi:hypothetical protein
MVEIVMFNEVLTLVQRRARYRMSSDTITGEPPELTRVRSN